MPLKNLFLALTLRIQVQLGLPVSKFSDLRNFKSFDNPPAGGNARHSVSVLRVLGCIAELGVAKLELFTLRAELQKVHLIYDGVKPT